ncbi:hypothetical protein ES703_78826 [subsurface metagenome]
MQHLLARAYWPGRPREFPCSGQELLSRATGGGPLLWSARSVPRWTLKSISGKINRKGVKTMVMQQPGDALLTGQISGRQLGNTIFQLLPAMPWEGPPGMPRGMAKQLFPRGFLQPAALPVPEIVQAAAVPPPVAAPPAPLANQVIPAAPVPARQPAPLVTRSISSGGEPISARSQRVRIRERSGM